MARPAAIRLSERETTQFRDAFEAEMRRSRKLREEIRKAPWLPETSSRWVERALSPSVKEMPRNSARELAARLLLVGGALDDLIVWNLLETFEDVQTLFSGQAEVIARGYRERLNSRPGLFSGLGEVKKRMIVADLKRYLQQFEVDAELERRRSAKFSTMTDFFVEELMKQLPKHRTTRRKKRRR